MTAAQCLEQPAGLDQPTGLDQSTGLDQPTASWIDQRLRRCPVADIPLARLRLQGSPRSGGVDRDHVRALAEAETELPPIVVHRPTWRVIDGVHRVLAARERGQQTIRARFYDGADDDAFLLGVGLNVGHGLPLSRADRTAAAERIATTHPNWSDRMVAVATGVSAATVGEIRRTSSAGDATGARVGRDGRVRPIDIGAGRVLAARLIGERPEASLRTIAREAGVSPATVQDVRRRLAAGEPVVPERNRRTTGAGRQTTPCRLPTAEPADPEATLSVLREDPALRFSQSGRGLLRWLEHHVRSTKDWEAVAGAVPDHCVGLVATMARSYSQGWSELAARLEENTPFDCAKRTVGQ